jgi:hypothetical protein
MKIVDIGSCIVVPPITHDFMMRIDYNAVD